MLCLKREAPNAQSIHFRKAFSLSRSSSTAAFGAVLALNFQTVSMILFGYFVNQWAEKAYPSGFGGFSCAAVIYSVTGIVIVFNWYVIGRWYYLTQMKNQISAAKEIP